MQSMLNLHGTFGLPLCVSGITHHHLTFSEEMADHDRRREAMKRQRSQARAELHANQELGFERSSGRVGEQIREGGVDEDLASLLHDLCCCYLACTAKAA
ncbi:uncharacterized protein Pyn_10266 [Prunus yedoensis var. nudiflora]|uniref:Uncharacterized protein n=1 Tax=Prunus yedoensis var. nudiflora TaxID=2094558 RepID=A0A314UD00_PRUYE|nr:uncharacterized protein Pyn_24942 [Prunus yedoensis var. nudiflora]PQM34626.1 uncharacterized protein Pyn_10266 [Prunus yedoensis var. nudiflora]